MVTKEKPYRWTLHRFQQIGASMITPKEFMKVIGNSYKFDRLIARKIRQFLKARERALGEKLELTPAVKKSLKAFIG